MLFFFQSSGQFYEDFRIEIYFSDWNGNVDTIAIGLSMNATDGFTPNYDVLDTAYINEDSISQGLDVRLIDIEVDIELVDVECYNLQERYLNIVLPNNFNELETFYIKFNAALVYDFYYNSSPVQMSAKSFPSIPFEVMNDLGLKIDGVEVVTTGLSLSPFQDLNTGALNFQETSFASFYNYGFGPHSICYNYPLYFYPISFNLKLDNIFYFNNSTITSIREINLINQNQAVNHIDVYTLEGKFILRLSNYELYDLKLLDKNIYIIQFKDQQNNILSTKKMYLK